MNLMLCTFCADDAWAALSKYQKAIAFRYAYNASDWKLDCALLDDDVTVVTYADASLKYFDDPIDMHKYL